MWFFSEESLDSVTKFCQSKIKYLPAGCQLAGEAGKAVCDESLAQSVVATADMEQHHKLRQIGMEGLI